MNRDPHLSRALNKFDNLGTQISTGFTKALLGVKPVRSNLLINDSFRRKVSNVAKDKFVQGIIYCINCCLK